MTATSLRGRLTNGSGVLDINDPVYNLRFQFFADVIPGCFDALDDNDDGEINVTDPIFSLSVQFLGRGPMPAPGHEECGSDPTEDALGCGSFPGCAG